MEPQMAAKRSHNLIKNELETKSTKHVENVINLSPLDLQETGFRIERLQIITKTTGDLVGLRDLDFETLRLLLLRSIF